MKTLLFSLSFFLLVSVSTAQVKPYHTTGMGFNFSYAMLDDTQNPNVIPRFSYFFNMNNNYHFDFSQNFGMFTGYSINNIGFITSYNDSLSTKKKYRTYNIGIPVGIKFGNLDKKEPFYFFLGGSMEIPVHFKEKTFYDDKKVDKFTEWASERVNLLQPNLFIGLTFPNKSTLRFKYYPLDYINSNFSENIGGNIIQPYSNIKHSNLIVISYGAGLTNIKKNK